VSTAFEGKRLIARHRALNSALADELAGPVHALALHTYTPEEWRAREGAPESPACRGGDGTFA
jgi:BolA protein